MKVTHINGGPDSIVVKFIPSYLNDNTIEALLLRQCIQTSNGDYIYTLKDELKHIQSMTKRPTVKDIFIFYGMDLKGEIGIYTITTTIMDYIMKSSELGLTKRLSISDFETPFLNVYSNTFICFKNKFNISHFEFDWKKPAPVSDEYLNDWVSFLKDIRDKNNIENYIDQNSVVSRATEVVKDYPYLINIPSIKREVNITTIIE